jgi:MGT family glycosyltransferase
MATIVFAMWPEAGHLRPSFKIAKGLRDRGHQVYYLGLLNSEEEVRSHGLDFIPVFADLFPKGFRQKQIAKISNLTGVKLVREMVRSSRKTMGIYPFLFSEDIDRLLKKIRPDLLVVDSLFPFMSLVAYRNKIRSVMLSVTLPQTRDNWVPPLTTDLIPGNGLFSRVKVRLSWYKIFLMRFLGRKTASLLGINADYHQVMKDLAKLANYPLEDIDTHTVFMPSLKMPELILCPREFDFPREDRKERYYVEACMGSETGGDPFPWDRLVDDKPLLFCTLGSQSHQSRVAKRFFQTVIDAIAAREEWQLVVATGEFLSVDDFRVPSPNVLVVNWAPHAGILKRASIMINHGGLGTIKECILFGVPMIIFPFMRDQRGNAARVVYHGLGVKGDIREISVSQIHSLIDTIQGNPEFKRRTEAMAKKFRDLEQAEKGVEIIERILERS